MTIKTWVQGMVVKTFDNPTESAQDVKDWLDLNFEPFMVEDEEHVFHDAYAWTVNKVTQSDIEVWQIEQVWEPIMGAVNDSLYKFTVSLYQGLSLQKNVAGHVTSVTVFEAGDSLSLMGYVEV